MSVQRHTRLHAGLWAPYKLTAYPAGFYGNFTGQTGDHPPVWEAEARVIHRGKACVVRLADAATIDEALEACWTHLARMMGA